MEYVAAFWAVLFPGALVAFNYELLQTLPRVAALRIYCAGIWHNAAACVICALALFLLPLALDPFYTYGDSPMVVNVSPTSPLSTYLSPQDLVLSLNGIRIHTVQDWKEAIALLNKQKPGMFQNSSDFEDSGAPSDKIGYCVPQSVAQESMAAEVDGNRTTCTDEFYAFSAIPCLHLYMLEEANDKDDYPADRSQRKIIYCISPEDVIKLKRCGYSQVKDRMNTLSCPCSEEESCFAPVQTPGLAWAEITYWRTHGCPLAAKDIVPQVKNGDFRENSCIQNFVFVGDIISLGRSLQLTSYRPRWPNTISMYLPGVMERLLIYTFNVSLTLALLNSLPVYYLDGESILELILQHMGFMTPMARGKFLRWFLRVGTFVSVLVFIWSFFLVA